MKQFFIKFTILAILVLTVTLKGISQYVSYIANYYGSASATVHGNMDLVTCDIPNGTTLTECTISIYHPDANSQNVTNSQFVNNMIIDITSSNFTNSLKNDIEMNEYTEFKLTSHQTSYFAVQQEYSCNTEVNMGMGLYSSYPFPTNLNNEYTLATTNINSNDPDIKSQAISLTHNCSTMYEAVRNIAIWVSGHLDYVASSTSDNSDQSASDVFDRKYGNCTGYTNLAIALLRSVNIPARFISGYAVSYPFNMPIFQTTFTWGNMNGPHAVYEVYYPDAGWCIADPQKTINFNSTHFIKHRTGADNCDKLKLVEGNYIGSTPPVFYLEESCGNISSLNNNYQYDSYIPFNAPKQYKTLLSVGPANPTGINDKIEITNTPGEFKTGDKVSFITLFTSGSNTYVTNWHWNIILYHQNGTYSLANETNNSNYWQVETSPLIPDYNWLYDSNNNIFGEIVVTASVSDGDTKQATMPLSIEECEGLFISNQTYTSNVTKQSCFITIDNVTVQNNAHLTLNSEKGVIIEDSFSLEAGAQLDIK